MGYIRGQNRLNFFEYIFIKILSSSIAVSDVLRFILDSSHVHFKFSFQCQSKPQAGEWRAWRTSYEKIVKNC